MSTALNNILILDDHWLFLDGLKTFLQHRYQCRNVFSADNAEQALECLDKNVDIDLILVDLEMPGINGIAFLHELRKRNIYITTIVMSGSDDLKLIQQALDSGAMGFIPKSLISAEIQAAINYVLQGNIFVPNNLQQALNDIANAVDAAALSERQIRVLELMQQGKSNQQAADELFITERTIKAHVSKIFGALNVTNRTACLSRARELGLIEDQNK